MKRLALAGVLFPFASLHVIAQMESGTIIVLNSSQDEIAVAADSRSHDATTYVDNRCKISVLGNELIFAASGKTGFGPLGSDYLVWDAHAVARDEFREVAHEHTSNRPLRLATRWGGVVKKKLQFDLIHHRDDTLSGTVGNAITSAVFAAFNADGGTSIVTGQITYRFTAKGKPITTFAITNKYDGPKAVFIGDTEIADEFNASKTGRAIQWRQEANAEATVVLDSIAFFAIKIVDLSIEHQPGKMINGKMMPTLGGPIDALRLVRRSGIDWIQRKPNCPEN